MNPNISATVAEFLPLAKYLVNHGKHHEILDQIGTKKDGICVMFNPFNHDGGCTEYAHRGLICRLFGFSAKFDKSEKLNLITCNPIKSTLQSSVHKSKLRKAPKMADYYMQLFGTNPNLSITYKPINEAIHSAIEYTMMHDNYRKKRA